MTDQQRQHLEQRLLQERDRAQRALERLDEAATIATEEDGDLTTYSQHLADNGTDTMEQEKSLALLSAEGARLTAIDQALQRVYKQPETYGRCDDCGTDIPFERLDVVPWARYCLDCQRRHEEGGIA
ncbi:MAG TPA: TraR/DksA C4-type zinc finger protein [Longimicrobiales bacterium]|nr:TraR/DksA C4-type zinc finger protein [Longimicrobiales bacterium]